MKKSHLFLLIFHTISISLVAQSSIRLNNYWDNTYYINPASINESILGEFSLASRKHWLNFPGAPTTYYAYGKAYIENLHTQFGLKAYKDEIGYTSTTDIELSYGYALRASRDWQLHLGFGLAYQSFSYDISKINLDDGNDITVFENTLPVHNLNTDVGVELQDKNWTFGLSGQNILSPFFKKNQQHSNTNFLYGKYRDHSGEFVNLGFGACAIQNGPLYQGEFNTTAYFSMPDLEDVFQVGVFYRTLGEVGGIFGFNMSRFSLYYSYDFNVTGIRRSSSGSHEFILVFKIDNGPVCKHCDYK